MLATCRIPECTFAETGVCLENNPPDQCPNRAVGEEDGETSTTFVPPPLSAPEQKPRFPSSLTMGLTEAGALMSERYCRVVGILGAPDSGKTASLASLFLLLGGNKLSGFEFSDSRTLMALNEIAQGARRFNEGSPPEQMTMHTELSEDRDAGFLHLRLKRIADKAIFDFLMPDLPGEWSDTFIDRNRADRLDFLKSADCIWIMADSRQLAKLDARRTILRRLDLLFGRVAALLDRPVPILLVLTHRDSGEASEEDMALLKASASAKNLGLDVVPISSFRRRGGQTGPGFGIADLITKTIGALPDPTPFWPVSTRSAEPRQMLRFRSAGVDHA